MSPQISALPQDAVLRLGSSQAIHDSVSVTKELIDNALDAEADNIKIILSENTLDSIQVTDNGRGMSVQDQAAVGRRHHTSKIETFADLENLGGSSLGFRGDALASVAELSGRDLTITTRTADVNVAAKLHVNRYGVLVSEHRTSHPVGTTVLVSDFLAPMPVRQRRAKQQVTQTCSRIKDLIRSYCVARLHVRFQVVWSRTAERKHDMVYAPPNKECSLKDTVLSLFGTSYIGNCFVANWPPTQEACEGSVIRIEAVLEKPTTQGRPHAMTGQFIAVDGRPISSDRGTAKKIYQIYREFFRDTNSPFLCMHLHCVSKSYDVNIEPAKDDVCFEDDAHVLETVEQFFTTAISAYRETSPPELAQSGMIHVDQGNRAHWEEGEIPGVIASYKPSELTAESEEAVQVNSSILPAATDPWAIAKLTGSSTSTGLLLNDGHQELPSPKDARIQWPLPTPDPSSEQCIPIKLLTKPISNAVSSFPDTNTSSQRSTEQVPRQLPQQAPMLQESPYGTLDGWLVSRSTSQKNLLDRLEEKDGTDTMEADSATPKAVQLLRPLDVPNIGPRSVRKRSLQDCGTSFDDSVHSTPVLRKSQRSWRALPEIAPGERKRSLRAHDRKLECRLNKPFRIPRAREPAGVAESQGPPQSTHYDRAEAIQQSLARDQEFVASSIPYSDAHLTQESSILPVQTRSGGTSTGCSDGEWGELVDFERAIAGEVDEEMESTLECLGLILDCSITQAAVEVLAHTIGSLQLINEEDATKSRAFVEIEESTILEWENCLKRRLHALDSTKDWSDVISIREALDGWCQESSLM